MGLTVTTLPQGYLEENSFLLTDTATGKTAVVDPCFERGMEAVKDLKADIILLTHGHFDHVGHCNALKQATNATVFAHAQEAIVLGTPSLNLSTMLGHDLQVCVDQLVQDNAVILLGETEIKVLHTPGHTPGSCCFLADGHLFTGDTLMAGSAGRTDLPLGDAKAQGQSLQRLRALPQALTLHCGHGTESTMEAEQKYNPFF